MSTYLQSGEHPITPYCTGDAHYSRDMFSGALNQTFTLHIDEAVSVPLTLACVEAVGVENAEFDSFSVYFTAPEDQSSLPDGSYLLTHADLGEMCLHLSATPTTSENPEDYEYEAVFSLRKSK